MSSCYLESLVKLKYLSGGERFDLTGFKYLHCLKPQKLNQPKPILVRTTKPLNLLDQKLVQNGHQQKKIKSAPVLRPCAK